jgi:hypothetical protein
MHILSGHIAFMDIFRYTAHYAFNMTFITVTHPMTDNSDWLSQADTDSMDGIPELVSSDEEDN